MLGNKATLRLRCIKEDGAREESIQDHVCGCDTNGYLNITHESIDELDTTPVKRLNEDSILRRFSFAVNRNKTAPDVGVLPDKDSNETL